MSNKLTLQEFTAEVMLNFGLGNLTLDVVDTDGKFPIVPALEHEPLASLMHRVMMTSGGYANVFVGGVGQVRQVSFIPTSDAVYAEDAEDMTDHPPAGVVTVGAFLDYLSLKSHGVNLPALIPIPTAAKASNVRSVVFEDTLSR